MLEVGVKAPDFELPDQNGKIHRLSDYAGKKVVLYFYSKDNTAGCTKQACGFSDYISNDKITDPGAFNVDPGHKTANLFGSKFTGNLTWKIIPSIVWESKLEYFTTYDTVIASWENTFNFVLNRYLSTKLFVHARYDDGVTLTEDNKSYFQLQELLSFGLNYTW